MISEEQKLARRKFIGSSDIAAIMGLDPWRSAADVYLDKIGALEEWAGNEATERGNLLEPAILKWAAGEIGENFLIGAMLARGCLAANFDGISGEPSGFIVEAKSSVMADEWGPNGTDEIPNHYLCQVHFAMYVAGPDYKTAYVPVLLPGFKSFDFRMYVVNRNDEIAESVASAGREFMTNYVIPRIRPDDFKPHFEVLRRVKRYPGDPIAIDGSLIDAYEAAKEIRLRHEKEDGKREDDANAALWSALDTAECGTDSLGRMAVISTVNRNSYEVKKSSYKTLKIKTPKLTAAKE